MNSFSEAFRWLSKVMIIAVLWGMIIPSSEAPAKIYKYKDDQGKTHFTDNPNNIPLKYRKEDTLKKFKGVVPSPEAASDSSPLPGSKGSAGSESAPAGEKQDAGLSAKEITLVEKTIQELQKGVALAERYKGAQPNASNGRGAAIAIQGNLPAKESLLKELQGTQVKALQPVLAFLTQSVAADRETEGIGSGLKTRIAGILSRIQDEGRKEADFIKQLEQALKESQKKKAEAAKKSKK